MSIKYLFFLLLLVSGPVVAANQSFADWIKDIKQQALAKGIRPQTAAVLDNLKPDERVIGFDRHQPEFVQTFQQYLNARVTDAKIRQARREYRENSKTLEAIGDKYGVDPAYIVSFWGLESGFGEHQGTYSVVRSLATLAYDQRRRAYFTSQLFAALKILDEGHISPDKFVGGWAGAMGQNQFMPSAFLNYAQDYDGDGRKNIWSDQEDVWASIANYLKLNGWKKGAGWGLQVMLPKHIDLDALKPEKVRGGCTAYKEQTRRLPVAEWRELGLKGDFGDAKQNRYALVVPDKGSRIAYLAGGNYDAILAYNCANKYAVSIGMLADLIRSGSAD